ncbi:MAG: hypothetical protein ACAH83_01465 [Alphaproteobacteria bacterium]
MSLKSVFAYLAVSAAATGAAIGIVAMDQQEAPRPFTCTTTEGEVYKGEMVEKGAIISGGRLHMSKGDDGLWRAENYRGSKVIPIKNATCKFDK